MAFPATFFDDPGVREVEITVQLVMRPDAFAAFEAVSLPDLKQVISGAVRMALVARDVPAESFVANAYRFQWMPVCDHDGHECRHCGSDEVEVVIARTTQHPDRDQYHTLCHDCGAQGPIVEEDVCAWCGKERE